FQVLLPERLAGVVVAVVACLEAVQPVPEPAGYAGGGIGAAVEHGCVLAQGGRVDPDLVGGHCRRAFTPRRWMRPAAHGGSGTAGLSPGSPPVWPAAPR